MAKDKIFPGFKELAEKDPKRFSEPLAKKYAANTHRWGGSDEMPGAKETRVQTKTGSATRVEKPGGVPKVNKIPITNFGGKSGGSGVGSGMGGQRNSMGMIDPSAVTSQVKKYASGGTTDEKSLPRRMYEKVMGTPEQNAEAQKRMDARDKKNPDTIPAKVNKVVDKVIGRKAGGKISSASSRGDGCAIKGKTKGRMV